MQVRVLYFGVLREILKRDAEHLELPAEASVHTLLETIHEAVPETHDLWGSLAVAVNREYAANNAMLRDGDEVALLPPVSGGSTAAGTDLPYEN